jgi:hypothetical protein
MPPTEAKKRGDKAWRMRRKERYRTDPAYRERILASSRRILARYRERHHERIRLKARAYDKVRRRQVKEWVNDIKSSPCADCGGVFDPACMDFDHRPGTTKHRGGVAALILETRNRERILAEIAKCDLVCSNCHRLRTKLRNLAAVSESKAA